MVTRREVLIFGASAACLSACGGGAGSGGSGEGGTVTANTGGGGLLTPPGPSPVPSSAGQNLYGTKIVEWTPQGKNLGVGATIANTASGAPSTTELRLVQSASQASAQQPVLAEVSGFVPKGASTGFTVGIWARNPQSHTLNFTFAIISASNGHEIHWHCAVDPSEDWVFLTMSPTQQLAMGWQFGSDVPASVRISQQDNMAEGPWQAGDSLSFGPVYVDVVGRPLFLLTFDDGFASQRHAPSAAVASGQQVVESYGFKGNLFIVPSWLGTTGKYGYSRRPNTFLSAEDVVAMHMEGWSIGSHSNTHPSSRDNAGLRLLGPYGYFLSNPVDNLPPSYVKFWGLNAAHRRRAISATQGSAVIVFENPHQFLINMPIAFTDVAPPGFSTTTVYFCRSIPSPTTATFATDQGSLQNIVNSTANWSGSANYRYPGSANDSSAIYADIMAGIDGLTQLGISTGASFFALPQGSADAYVRSACIRAQIHWVRGASSVGQTFPIGRPTGGGLSNIVNEPGGWIGQPDCIQTDGASSPSLDKIQQYVNATITQSACGCSYHHDVSSGTIGNLDGLCAFLKGKVDAKLLDVVTLDQLEKMRQKS
jgi:hypothetical protein